MQSHLTGRPRAISGLRPSSNQRKIPVIELANAPAATVSAGGIQSASGPGLTALRNTGYNAQRLRRGDVIDITVLDTGEDGLFSPTQSKTLNLGRFTVDQSGSVNIPFVGKQRVIDSTPEGLQSQVVAGLKGSAVNPQAVVTVVDKPTSAVMLSGAVKTPGKIVLTARQERVLDSSTRLAVRPSLRVRPTLRSFAARREPARRLTVSCGKTVRTSAFHRMIRS